MNDVRRQALQLFGHWWERPMAPLRVSGGVLYDGQLRLAAQRR